MLAVKSLLLFGGVCFGAELQASWHHSDFGTGKGGINEWDEGCDKGSQSPIDLRFSSAAETDAGVEYRCSPIDEYELENVQTTIKVTPTGSSAGACKLVTSLGEYNLLHYHFHTPAEHTIDGKVYDMEMHFVNQNKAGEIAVLGIFFQVSDENPDKDNEWLATFWGDLPTVPISDVEQLREMYASKKMFESTSKNSTRTIPPFTVTKSAECFMYEGSLTTPPCTTGLEWNVVVEPLAISSAQLKQFRDAMAFDKTGVEGNARPVQPTRTTVRHFREAWIPVSYLVVIAVVVVAVSISSFSVL
eukprot:TRINITY_DN3842_c0_g1_i1.p1 TRINITY_DN3842_c0_g1~~TRINITY_DN3842_c0_g1_i1.p1  ORF type:complete len:302 (+),score=55.97 TRINITY_DN3842_c0_g1_i1:43-948(+)